MDTISRRLHRLARIAGRQLDACDCDSNDAELVADALAELMHRLGIESMEHTRRLDEGVRAMCRAIGTDARALSRAARMHDVGKIAIPEERTWLPMRRDDPRMLRILAHSALGRWTLAANHELAEEAAIVHAHHEYWNGSGYPRRLSGEAIPLGARIFTIVDAHDAITRTDSIFGRGKSHDEAMAEIRRLGGVLYDPALVRIFEAIN